MKHENQVVTQSTISRKASMCGIRTASAFTLIELLVVILIIGILAAIALPQYQKAVKLARYQQIIAIGDAFAKAQTLYYLEHGSYAKNVDDFLVSFPKPNQVRSTTNGDCNYSHFSYSWGTITFRCTNTSTPDIQVYPNKLPPYQVFPRRNTFVHTCFAGINDSIGRYICQSVAGNNVEPTKHGDKTLRWDF